MFLNVPVLFLFLLGFLEIWSSPILPEPDTVSAICDHLCGRCGGKGEVQEDVCLCKMRQSAELNNSCLRKAEAQARFIDIGWKLETTNEADESLYSKEELDYVPEPDSEEEPVPEHHIVPRSPQLFEANSYNYYGSQANPTYNPYQSGSPGNPTYNPYQSVQPNYGYGNSAQGNTYELIIGDSDEDKVELIFPDSDGLELEHQYIFQGDDGVEHPCSRPITDFDRTDINSFSGRDRYDGHSDNKNKNDPSWGFGVANNRQYETNSYSGERPLNNFNYGMEDRNYRKGMNYRTDSRASESQNAEVLYNISSLDDVENLL